MKYFNLKLTEEHGSLLSIELGNQFALNELVFSDLFKRAESNPWSRVREFDRSRKLLIGSRTCSRNDHSRTR